MKFCEKCGAQMPDEALCCTNCGAPLQASQVPNQPYQQQSYQQQPYQQQPYQQQPYQQQPYQQQPIQQQPIQLSSQRQWLQLNLQRTMQPRNQSHGGERLALTSHMCCTIAAE